MYMIEILQIFERFLGFGFIFCWLPFAEDILNEY